MRRCMWAVPYISHRTWRDLVCIWYVGEVVVWWQRTKRIPRSFKPEFELVINASKTVRSFLNSRVHTYQAMHMYVEHSQLATCVNKLAWRLKFNTRQQLKCCRALSRVLLLNDSTLTQDHPFAQRKITRICNIAFEWYCSYYIKIIWFLEYL